MEKIHGQLRYGYIVTGNHIENVWSDDALL
jgi:hypothetical protein